MYNLRVLDTTLYRYNFSLELVIAFLILIIIVATVIIIFFKKYNVLFKLSQFLNRDKKLIQGNYTLAFEYVKISREIQPKKISAVTKIVLFGLCLFFIFTPFNDLLPTMDSSLNYYLRHITFF